MDNDTSEFRVIANMEEGNFLSIQNGYGISFDNFIFILGDINFDGIVDILDIVRIVNYIMGDIEFNENEFTGADYNADGIVNILDIVQIVNYILAN